MVAEKPMEPATVVPRVMAKAEQMAPSTEMAMEPQMALETVLVTMKERDSEH